MLPTVSRHLVKVSSPRDRPFLWVVGLHPDLHFVGIIQKEWFVLHALEVGAMRSSHARKTERQFLNRVIIYKRHNLTFTHLERRPCALTACRRQTPSPGTVLKDARPIQSHQRHHAHLLLCWEHTVYAAPRGLSPCLDSRESLRHRRTLLQTWQQALPEPILGTWPPFEAV